jgi:predicted AlkP superfamily pyrophosphatase or phosphodiesterase
VERFNRDEMPRVFGDSVWEESGSLQARALARGDTAEYEGDGTHTTFPHRFHEEVRDPSRPGALSQWAYGKTHPDAALGEFAREAVRTLGMGQDRVTDYLGLSFSQADAVGHDYGPLSREQLDNLLHLDRVLGELMVFLDEEVGQGRWVMALAGDHGVMTMPEYLAAEGEAGSRASTDHFRDLRRTFQEYQDRDGDPQEVAEELVAALEAFPFVGDAMTVSELTSGTPADSFAVLMRNSYHPARWIGPSGSQESGVVFRFAEAYYPSTDAQGTGHGSPYFYDRHVPLIFYGPGLEAGVSMDPVRTVDIAPTLARLAGIQVPADLDGRPILE